MSQTLSHTLTVRPNLFIRAYLRFYGADSTRINTCKLFWGGVGLVVLPPLLLVVSPIIALIVLGAWADDKLKYRASIRAAERRVAFLNAPPTPPVETGPSRRERALEWVSIHAPIIWGRIGAPVIWFVRLVVGTALVGGVVYGGYHGIKALLEIGWGDVLAAILTALPWIGLAIVIIAVILGILWAYDAWRAAHPKPVRAKKPSVFKAVLRSIHDHTCANVQVERD